MSTAEPRKYGGFVVREDGIAHCLTADLAGGWRNVDCLLQSSRGLSPTSPTNAKATVDETGLAELVIPPVSVQDETMDWETDSAQSLLEHTLWHMTETAV